MRVFERDDLQYELRVKDSTEGDDWHMTISKLKFPQGVQEGEVYRIRGVHSEKTTERKVITSKPSTNFLRFPL